MSRGGIRYNIVPEASSALKQICVGAGYSVEVKKMGDINKVSEIRELTVTVPAAKDWKPHVTQDRHGIDRLSFTALISMEVPNKDEFPPAGWNRELHILFQECRTRLVLKAGKNLYASPSERGIKLETIMANVMTEMYIKNMFVAVEGQDFKACPPLPLFTFDELEESEEFTHRYKFVLNYNLTNAGFEHTKIDPNIMKVVLWSALKTIVGAPDVGINLIATDPSADGGSAGAGPVAAPQAKDGGMPGPASIVQAVPMLPQEKPSEASIPVVKASLLPVGTDMAKFAAQMNLVLPSASEDGSAAKKQVPPSSKQGEAVVIVLDDPSTVEDAPVAKKQKLPVGPVEPAALPSKEDGGVIVIED